MARVSSRSRSVERRMQPTPMRDAAVIGPLVLAPDAKLVAGADQPPIRIDRLAHLLALDQSTLLVGQPRGGLARAGLDDLASRRIRIPAVEAERDPAGLIAQLKAGQLARRHDRRVEN